LQLLTGTMPNFLESVPVRGYLGLGAVGLTCGLVGSLVGVAAVPVPPAPPPTIAIAPTVEEPVVVEAAAPVREESASLDEVEFVFTADRASYLALETVETNALPKHGTPRLVVDEYVHSAIASLREPPLVARAWQGREVIVDSTCRAHVTGFALIGRITGDPGYADDGSDDDAWTARQIFEYGRVTLAAKLDNCSGTYARAASAEAIRVFAPAIDREHEAEARLRLLGSKYAGGIAAQWKEYGMEGTWDQVIVAKTLRDPQTGTTWISMHAIDQEGCGGVDINVWGLFRVETDGTLTTVQLRPLGELNQIDKLVDIDGDGVPEILGRGWISPDAALTTAAGDSLGEFTTPFYGCPC
jgi:hypothetical protein